MAKILVIEDDSKLSEFLKKNSALCPIVLATGFKELKNQFR